jgi:hypothetical protein
MPMWGIIAFIFRVFPTLKGLNLKLNVSFANESLIPLNIPDKIKSNIILKSPSGKKYPSLGKYFTHFVLIRGNGNF